MVAKLGSGEFDKSFIHITVPNFCGLELRSASVKDMEIIREWKNREQEYFFSKKIITQSEQENWYALYKQRKYDFMLMTVFERRSFGCMGIRWKLTQQAGHWDIYNVILGLSEYGGRGLMGHAFASLLNYAIKLKSAPITLQVLKRNPAVRWYQRNGFVVSSTHCEYFSMMYQPNISKE